MDPREIEVRDKLTAMVATEFNGDMKAAFTFFDLDADGKIGQTELHSMLTTAGIGNVLTRNWWVSGIISRLDKDGDGEISWDEFQAASQ